MSRTNPDPLVCAACGVGVPLVKNWLRIAAMGLLASGFAGAKTKSVGWALLSGIVGLGAGVVVDAVAQPICGQCVRSHAHA